MDPETAVEWLASSSWVVLGSIAIGVAGLVYAIVTRSRTKLTFAVVSGSVISKSHKALSRIRVTYDDRVVDGVGITQIAMWNSGNQTIDGSALETTEPLRIVPAEEALLLDPSLIGSTATVCNVRLENPTEQGVRIRFDYLNPGDGFVVQAVHTLGSKGRARPAGEVKGVSHLRRKRPGRLSSEPSSMKHPFGWRKRDLALAFMISGQAGVMIAVSLFRGDSGLDLFPGLLVILIAGAVWISAIPPVPRSIRQIE